MAALYGTQGKATGLNALSVRHPDGTETIHPLPAGTSQWLQQLFPQLGWRHEVRYDSNFNTYVFRFSRYRDALVTKTHSRELCAREWGVLP